MNIIKKNDLIMGEYNEKQCISIISDFLNYKLEKTKEKFNTFDFINKDNKIISELKSRNCCYSSYEDTMIGFNKILKGLKMINDGYKVYLFFKFIDGLYYYKLDNAIHDNWIRDGGRTDRGQIEINKYYYIPVNKLSLVSMSS